MKTNQNMPKSDQRKKPLRRININSDLFIFTMVNFYIILYAQSYSTLGSFCMAVLCELAEDYAKVSISSSDSLSSEAILNLMSILLLVIGIRVYYVLREFVLWNRFYNNPLKLVMTCIGLPHWPTFVLALIIQITYLVYCFISTKQSFKQAIVIEMPNILVDFIAPLLNVMLGVIFKWYETPMTESYRIEDPLSFSGGSSMAFSFYYGYLKLILKDFPKRLQDFIDNEDVDKNKIPLKKLFILIPSSSQVINNPYHPDIKAITNKFESHREDRGMVLAREYKNTVYQIYDKDGNVKYILPVEYATPLKTFYETMDSLNGSKFKEFRREVITSFYYTLEKIITEDKEMRERVELIYYNDEKPDSLCLRSLLKRRIKLLLKLKKES